MIPIERQTTMRAVVPAHREVFLYLALATTALLACTSGIDFHESRPGTFGLVTQHAHEAAPSGIRDCPGKPGVRQHPLDVQRFDSEQAVDKDQTTGDFSVSRFHTGIMRLSLEYSRPGSEGVPQFPRLLKQTVRMRLTYG